MAFLSHLENGLDHFFCKAQAVNTLRFVGSSVVVGTQPDTPARDWLCVVGEPA